MCYPSPTHTSIYKMAYKKPNVYNITINDTYIVGSPHWTRLSGILKTKCSVFSHKIHNKAAAK